MKCQLSIQEKLKDLRVEKGLSLEELASEIGLSKSALGSYEINNHKDISHASYIKLQDENYIDDFEDEESINKTLPFSRCPICGDYIKQVKNKKYCNKPECQKRRAAIKSRNYTLRKKTGEIKKRARNHSCPVHSL